VVVAVVGDLKLLRLAKYPRELAIEHDPLNLLEIPRIDRRRWHANALLNVLGNSGLAPARAENQRPEFGKDLDIRRRAVDLEGGQIVAGLETSDCKST
jgi:hypothetical protein